MFQRAAQYVFLVPVEGLLRVINVECEIGEGFDDVAEQGGHLDGLVVVTETGGLVDIEFEFCVMSHVIDHAINQVILIAGPVDQKTPPGVIRVDVESARDMLGAVKTAFLGSESRAKGSFGKKGGDALFMAAAVGDWRPKRRLSGKWRAKDGGDEVASLELVKNPDILATVGRRKGSRLVVGFALETGSGLKRAMAKLNRKSADFIVLNNETALGANRTTVAILGKDGSRVNITNKTKRDVARALVQLHYSNSAPAE